MRQVELELQTEWERLTAKRLQCESEVKRLQAAHAALHPAIQHYKR
jgi:hypothetical protein